MAEIRLRPHHVSTVAHHYFNPDSVGFYGPEFDEHLSAMCDHILYDDVTIEIVSDLDTICLSAEPACPKKEPECSVPSDLDEFCLHSYDLTIGDVFTSSGLQDGIKAYASRTGYWNPTMFLHAVKGRAMRDNISGIDLKHLIPYAYDPPGLDELLEKLL